MNKDRVIKKYFHKIEQLTLRDSNYLKTVDELIKWLLASDMTEQDLTTKKLGINKNDRSKAVIVTRKNITLAGVEEVSYLLKKFTTLKYKIIHKDGDTLKPGDKIFEITGSTAQILAYERVLLNIMQRLSGIATETQGLVRRIEKIKNKPFIAATRKTNWGLLDKKAVASGGGLTHRLSLSDGVLVKDNHLLLIGMMYDLSTERDIVSKTLELLLKSSKNTLIEIEVEKEESIKALIEQFSSMRTSNVLGILLDNFSQKNAKKVLNDVKRKYDVSSIVFEGSGGITDENIIEWAKTGVDLISLGALTHSAKAADISLDLML